MATIGATPTTKTFKKITNAWTNRTLPDIFYEEPEYAEDAVLQETPLLRLIFLLHSLFEDRPDVFMSGMVFVSYDETDGNARLAPDFFIAFDVPNESIRTNLPNFWVWEIGKVPDFALEMASPSTADNDLGYKRDKYAELGIAEYWRFDATGGELYGQPMVGERLVDGEYQPYEIQEEADGSLRAYSPMLNVDFYWDGDEFDVLDPVTGITVDKRIAAEERAEIAEERAEIAHDRAEMAQERAEIAQERANAEREARIAAEERERALLEELNRLRQQR